jgi:1-deoxy-D-xylulose-5-phosphate reductoisomerase
VSGVSLTFEDPDRKSFPCLDLGYEAGRMGGTATAVLNAADEVAVGEFLAGRIRFVDIARVVVSVLESHTPTDPRSVEDIAQADAEARIRATEISGRL